MVGWAEQFLSQAGKEVFVKAVAMAMPNYAISCFKLPIRVCRDMEKAMERQQAKERCPLDVLGSANETEEVRRPWL